jgi:hypothetical protein
MYIFVHGRNWLLSLTAAAKGQRLSLSCWQRLREHAANTNTGAGQCLLPSAASLQIFFCHPKEKYSLFGWLVADGWCWFVLREEYCWLVAAGCWWLVRSERKVLLAGG